MIEFCQCSDDLSGYVNVNPSFRVIPFRDIPQYREPSQSTVIFIFIVIPR